MQMSLVTEHTAFFSAMIEMTRQVHHVFALWQGCNFSRIEALDFRVFVQRTQSIH